MGNIYLLTGEPRTGKSSVVKYAIDAIGKEYCGGFYTEEICTEGARVGFQLVTLDGQQGLFAHVNSLSQLRVGRYGVNLECLETLGVNALLQALTTKSLLVLDEIGPMQLFSQQFTLTLKEILHHTRPLLATIALETVSLFSDFEHHHLVSLYHLTKDNQTTLVTALLHSLQQEIP